MQNDYCRQQLYLNLRHHRPLHHPSLTVVYQRVFAAVELNLNANLDRHTGRTTHSEVAGRGHSEGHDSLHLGCEMSEAYHID